MKSYTINKQIMRGFLEVPYSNNRKDLELAKTLLEAKGIISDIINPQEANVLPVLTIKTDQHNFMQNMRILFDLVKPHLTRDAKSWFTNTLPLMDREAAFPEAASPEMAAELIAAQMASLETLAKQLGVQNMVDALKTPKGWVVE